LGKEIEEGITLKRLKEMRVQARKYESLYE